MEGRLEPERRRRMKEDGASPLLPLTVALARSPPEPEQDFLRLLRRRMAAWAMMLKILLLLRSWSVVNKILFSLPRVEMR